MVGKVSKWNLSENIQKLFQVYRDLPNSEQQRIQGKSFIITYKVDYLFSIYPDWECFAIGN